MQLRRRFFGRTFLFGIVALLTLLIIARAMLPGFVERYVNRTLNTIPDYRGHIGTVSIQLFRGAYTIKNVSLEKTTGKVPVPLFKAPTVDLSIEWSALFHGKVVGKIYVDHPTLNFVNSKSKDGAQLSVGDEWLSAVKNLFPLRINRFEIHSGDLHYRDFESSPHVDVRLTNIVAIGTNFNNTRTPSRESMARVDATALAEGKSNLSVHAVIQPAEKSPTFKIKCSLEGLEAKSLNDLLEAYAAVQANAGTIDVYLEMVAENDEIRGNVKPLVKNLSVLKLQLNPLQMVWDSIVAIFTEILTNQRHDQLGSSVPFEGKIGKTQVNIWETIGSLLSNAFIKALKPGAPDTVHFTKPTPPVPTPEALPNK